MFILAGSKIGRPANPATLRPAPTNGFAAFVKSRGSNAQIVLIADSSKSLTKSSAGIYLGETLLGATLSWAFIRCSWMKRAFFSRWILMGQIGEATRRLLWKPAG